MSPAKKQSSKLKGGVLIEDDKDTQEASRWAILKATSDINQLPTWEVLRRIYVRHNLRLWQTAALTTWAALIWFSL